MLSVATWTTAGGADALHAHDYAVTMMLYIVYLCYAVAGIVVIIALQIYIKINTGEEGVKKNIMMLVGACIFLIGATIVFPLSSVIRFEIQVIRDKITQSVTN